MNEHNQTPKFEKEQRITDALALLSTARSDGYLPGFNDCQFEEVALDYNRQLGQVNVFRTPQPAAETILEVRKKRHPRDSQGETVRAAVNSFEGELKLRFLDSVHQTMTPSFDQASLIFEGVQQLYRGLREQTENLRFSSVSRRSRAGAVIAKSVRNFFKI